MVQRSGEDLEAKGLTEFLWDVLYWTWACILGAAVLGDWFWCAWGVVPIYSVWLGWKTYSGVRGGMSGMMGGADGADSTGPGSGDSKRQKKLEKRGGQRMQYR